MFQCTLLHKWQIKNLEPWKLSLLEWHKPPSEAVWLRECRSVGYRFVFMIHGHTFRFAQSIIKLKQNFCKPVNIQTSYFCSTDVKIKLLKLTWSQGNSDVFVKRRTPDPLLLKDLSFISAATYEHRSPSVLTAFLLGLQPTWVMTPAWYLSTTR